MSISTRVRVPTEVVAHAPGCPQLTDDEVGCDQRSCYRSPAGFEDVSIVVGTAEPPQDPSLDLGPAANEARG